MYKQSHAHTAPPLDKRDTCGAVHDAAPAAAISIGRAQFARQPSLEELLVRRLCVCLCRGQCRCRCFACACAGVGARRLVLGTGLSAGLNSKILHRYTDTHAHLMYACMYACSSHRHHSPDQVVIPPDVCTPDQVCPKHICNVCVCIYTCVCVCVYRHAHRYDVYTFRSLSSGRTLT